MWQCRFWISFSLGPFSILARDRDRAFAAHSRSYVRKYTACDPNVLACELIKAGAKANRPVGKRRRREGQQEAASDRARPNNCNSSDEMFVVHGLPVEDFFAWSEACNDTQKHDMIFTSPPFGDTEIYEEKKEELDQKGARG